MELELTFRTTGGLGTWLGFQVLLTLMSFFTFPSLVKSECIKNSGLLICFRLKHTHTHTQSIVAFQDRQEMQMFRVYCKLKRAIRIAHLQRVLVLLCGSLLFISM